jgi:hypothetical protein
MDQERGDKGFDRRRFLQGAGIAGAAAWAAPAVISSPASADGVGSGAPPCRSRGRIFFDDFTEDSSGLNQYSFSNWWVPDPSGGSVDLGNFAGGPPPQVDLDGSTSVAGRFALKDGLGGTDAGSHPGNNTTDQRPTKAAGLVYTLSFDIVHADPNGNDTYVKFGELAAQPFPTFTGTGTFIYQFTATSGGPIDLWFKNRFTEGGGDNTGPYLTNVTITESCPG